jgi:tetratricopeptide (TPR) repeat protein
VSRRRRYIREYKTKIEILTVMTGYENRFDEITSCYEKIIPLALEEKIELDVVYDFISFLNYQGKNPICLMEKLEKAYDSVEAVDDYEKASLYNLMGIVYKNQGKPAKAEEYYQKAIRISEKLTAENPDRYSGALATSYNNAGIFYTNQGNPTKAEEYYQKSIAIYAKLTAENPKRYSGDLAMSYNNAGVFYNDHGNPIKAEEYYQKAIEIYKELTAENPDRYSGDLAVSYFNFAIFKGDNHYFKKAYELAKANPHNPSCRKIVEVLKGKFE